MGEVTVIKQTNKQATLKTNKEENHSGLSFLDSTPERGNASFSVFLLTFAEQHIVYLSEGL